MRQKIRGARWRRYENIFIFQEEYREWDFVTALIMCTVHGADRLGKKFWDDRVEMEVQGTREEIREMVERLSQQSFVEIEGIESKEIPLEDEFGFHVKG